MIAIDKFCVFCYNSILILFNAGVAKSADAGDLKSSGHKPTVRVRVPVPARTREWRNWQTHWI